MRVFNRTELPIAIEGGGVDFRMDRRDGHSVAWVRLPTGADLRPGLAVVDGLTVPMACAGSYPGLPTV